MSLFFVAMEDASNNILEMGTEIFAAVFYFVSFLCSFCHRHLGLLFVLGCVLACTLYTTG